MTPPSLWRRLWHEHVVPAFGGTTERDRALIADLRRDVARLDTVAHDTERDWAAHRARLRELAVHGNPMEFLRWDVVRRTMLAGDTSYVAVELRHLRRRSDWRSRWRWAVRESALGRPRPFFLYPRSSGTLLHHAYHACRFEEVTGARLDHASLIVEFGGGYGAMCRLVHGLGFTGRYVIFDLPELSALQRFYLNASGIPASTDATPLGVVTTSEVDGLSALVRQASGGRTVFIATWSLSETPVALRETILGVVHDFDAFLIAYQKRFAEVANDEFFRTWRAGLGAGLTWHEIAIEHLAKASWYLFGTREASPSS